MDNQQEQLKSIVCKSLESFNASESYLIENDLSERCICARYALHLTEALEDSEYGDYFVDVEYNRGAYGKEYGIKKIDGHPITVDLIVHKRVYDTRTGFSNLICMEMKKSTDCRGCDDDIERLRKLCSSSRSFRYSIGFMLLVNMENKRIEIKETILYGENNRLLTPNGTGTVSEW